MLDATSMLIKSWVSYENMFSLLTAAGCSLCPLLLSGACNFGELEGEYSRDPTLFVGRVALHTYLFEHLRVDNLILIEYIQLAGISISLAVVYEQEKKNSVLTKFSPSTLSSTRSSYSLPYAFR